jgi:intracellular multiplication protein IcmQ
MSVGRSKSLMPNTNKEQNKKLLQLMRNAVQQDNEMRQKFQVGDKFRFIRDRLNALLARMEEGISALEKEDEQKVIHIADDEMVVYVYLYNAQGLAFQTWQKMLNPSVFYEYSVNRPIYADLSFVEAFVRSKTNKMQHAYLTIVIKKQDVITTQGAEIQKDALGNPLIKVKEGSLHFIKMVAFTHNSIHYIVNDRGEVIKKPT